MNRPSPCRSIVRSAPLVFLAIALLSAGRSSFLFRTTAAQAPTPLNACQTILQSGSYQLANDITAPANQICFSIRANNVTFDGNGRTITANGAEALEVADFGYGPYSNITITNFTSNDGVRAYGDLNHHLTFDHLTVSSIVDYASDDVSITNNTVGEGGINVNNADNASWSPFRPIITNNTITGGSTDVKTLLEIAGGANHPCPRIDGIVTNNTVTNTRNDPPPEATAAVRIRCATHTTFTGNTIHSTGTTIGLYMRDESDNGTYENNTFWTHDQETLRIASGNVDKTLPSNNTFKNNVFRSDNVAVMYFQGMGHDNVFQNNTFWGASDGLTSVTGSSGNMWDHNTFYVTGTGTLTSLSYRDGPPSDSWTNNIFDYSGSSLYGYDGWGALRYAGNNNLYHNRAGAAAFGFLGATLAAFKTSTGQDAASTEGDPLFVDPPNGDFHLQTASPARGSGADAGDVGAFPFSAPGCTENWSYGAWITCTNHLQTRTATDGNSCGTTRYRLPLTRTCDNTPPTTSVTAPPSGGTVAGTTVSVTADAADDLVVKGVQFQLDGNDLGGEDVNAPYETTWNTTSTADGQHLLTAIARDASDNNATSSTVTVTSNNGVTCVEDWVTIGCTAWSSCTSGTQTRTCTDANSCGTVSNRPAVTQSCTNGPQCGTTCNGCTTNHILGPACTTPSRQCDQTNTVEDVRLSSSTLTAGQSLDIQIDYSCFASDDNLALWYYNGSSWRLIQSWAQSTLTGCNGTAGTDGTRSVTFTPDSINGTHYIRAIEAAGAVLSSASSCPNLTWGNIDDLAFTVSLCTENWHCTDWSTCVNGTQTTVCTDANSCGTIITRPPLTQSCTVADTAPPATIGNLSAH